jgi:NTP pyrophosphatase (non-canonical NTP hydrolase)
MSHFNQLTPSEAERLAMLAEECAEVIQVIGKILRHGYASYHPDDPHGPDNQRLLEKELIDVFAVHIAMFDAGDIRSPGVLEDVARKRWLKKLQYTHHQEKTP